MTPEEEKQLKVLLEKKHTEDRERLAKKVAEKEKAKKEYSAAWWQARAENKRAHASVGPLPEIVTRPTNFDFEGRPWASDALKEGGTYLCLDSACNRENAYWFIGIASYYEEQQRWLMSGSYGSHQVEHLLQVHEIDLPVFPNNLVPMPEKPAILIDEEESDEEEDRQPDF